MDMGKFSHFVTLTSMGLLLLNKFTNNHSGQDAGNLSIESLGINQHLGI